MYRRQMKKIYAFMMLHLRSIMRITWLVKVTNKDILERTGLPSMEDLLIRKNLRWTGQATKVESLLSTVFWSQKERNLKLRDIKADSWSSLSQQRDKLREIVK